jgi:excisionase family DNA binding protein
MKEKKYLTMKEAMEVLDLTYRGVHEHIRKGNIKAIRSSSRTLFIPEEEINKFLATHRLVENGSRKVYVALPNSKKEGEK